MMPSFPMIMSITYLEHTTHSNLRCDCFCARNEGIIRADQALI